MTKQNDMPDDVTTCPRCKGPADNGFDRCYPPSPYLCTRCADKPADNGGDELVWEDGNFPMDTTMLFSQSYNFDGLECFSQKTVTPIGRFMIWPDGRPDKKWNVYGERDGYFRSDLENGTAAKLEVEQAVSHAVSAPHPPEVTTCPDGMSCSGNGMDCVGDGLCKGPEVSGEVDDRMKAQIDYGIDLQRIIEAICHGYEIPTPKTTARHHYNMASEYIASRNLLKSEGVCVPQNVIEKIWGVLELSASQMTWFANYTNNFNKEAGYTISQCREAINALRPFLPAEKE